MSNVEISDSCDDSKKLTPPRVPRLDPVISLKDEDFQELIKLKLLYIKMHPDISEQSANKYMYALYRKKLISEKEKRKLLNGY